MNATNLKNKIGTLLAPVKYGILRTIKNKKIAAGIIAIAGLAIAGGIAWQYAAQKGPQNGQDQQQTEKKLDPRNCKYIVEGQVVTLAGGKEETISPYGNQTQITEVYGDPIIGDLNTDGEDDYAMVITQKTSNDVGVYYYAAVALADEEAGVIAGTMAVPLGDRIVIKDIAIVNQAFRVNYLDWKTDGDAVEESPSNPMSKSFILDGIMLKELTERRANAQAEAACTDNGGVWTMETNECKGLSKEWCENNAGAFENDTCKF